MTIRRRLLVLAALPALLAAEQAQAAVTLGSPDPSAAPDAFACEMAGCPPGQSVGFRQFALQGAAVTAEESGVLVSARVHAKRIAGAEQPRIAVLSPAAGDDIGVTVGAFAPLPVVSREGALHEVRDLHLPVTAGDSLGFILPTGQVDLGVRTRRRPDGAVQWFSEPCGPCHMDGGTGTELLFEGEIEPDFDEDGLGDETQDPDAGFGFDELDDEWLDDWDDELDEDEEAAPDRRRRFQLLGLALAPNGDPGAQAAHPADRARERERHHLGGPLGPRGHGAHDRRRRGALAGRRPGPTAPEALPLRPEAGRPPRAPPRTRRGLDPLALDAPGGDAEDSPERLGR